MRIRLIVVVSLLWALSAMPLARSAKEPAPELHVARYGHTATALFDGRVLVAGGEDAGICTASQEIYDPATGAWSDSTPMPACRSAHTATRLSGGRVLMAGGLGAGAVRSAGVDVYDPVVESWTPAEPMPAPRYGHNAELLANGNVQVCGGITVNADVGDVAASDCVTYAPSSNRWIDVTPLPGAAAAALPQGHTTTVLSDGRVLVAGGFDAVGHATANALVYDSVADTWTPTAALAIARSAHTATLLPSGDVLMAGGAAGPDGVALNSVEIWRLPDEPRTVVPATATLTLSKSPQQYSDLETFEATMSPAIPGQPIAGSVTFKVGTQDMGAAPLLLEGTVYKARLTTALLERVPGQMQPTTPFGRTVTAVMNAPNFQVANATRALVITKEDARATFDGTHFAVTSGTGTTNTAAVTLRATIRDITAAEPAQDANAGDIRGAYAQFYNRETGLAISPAMPVTLLKADDTSTGLVTYKWTPAAGSANSQTFRVGIMLGTFYLRNSSSEDALVTIAKPIAPRFLTGGGLLPGGVNGFGLGVQYNGTGSAPSGQFQTMVQSGGKVFHVKSGTLSSLVVSGTSATLKGSASIYDVSNGSVVVDSRATFEAKLTDNGAGANDVVTVTIRSGSGALWFSSSAAGGPQTLAGGDLIVR